MEKSWSEITPEIVAAILKNFLKYLDACIGAGKSIRINLIVSCTEVSSILDDDQNGLFCSFREKALSFIFVTVFIFHPVFIK